MFKQIKQAFAVFIETCKALTEALRENTASLREQTAALRTYNAASAAHTSNLDTIAKHTEYLATAQSHSLQRAGQRHIFKG
jgi:hypothetical protein